MDFCIKGIRSLLLHKNQVDTDWDKFYWKGNRLILQVNHMFDIHSVYLCKPCNFHHIEH